MTRIPKIMGNTNKQHNDCTTPKTIGASSAVHSTSSTFIDVRRPSNDGSKKEDEEEKNLLAFDPLAKRRFVTMAKTSTSVQVAWTHPTEGLKTLLYVLEYGVGIKVAGKEQFRQIYKGKAHKCIITDLMPRYA